MTPTEGREPDLTSLDCLTSPSIVVRELHRQRRLLDGAFVVDVEHDPWRQGQRLRDREHAGEAAAEKQPVPRAPQPTLQFGDGSLPSRPSREFDRLVRGQPRPQLADVPPEEVSDELRGPVLP